MFMGSIFMCVVYLMCLLYVKFTLNIFMYIYVNRSMFECPGGSRGGDIQDHLQPPGLPHPHRLLGQDLPAVGRGVRGVPAGAGGAHRRDIQLRLQL